MGFGQFPRVHQEEPGASSRDRQRQATIGPLLAARRHLFLVFSLSYPSWTFLSRFLSHAAISRTLVSPLLLGALPSPLGALPSLPSVTYT